MQISYYLGHESCPVRKETDQWTSPIPMGRKNTSENAPAVLSYGDYFKAIESFLKKDARPILIQALCRKINPDVFEKEVEKISIIAEKHGEFYHPARLSVTAKGITRQFVLNVAVSETGKRFIQKEAELIEKLNRKGSANYLPRVYGFGKAAVTGRQSELLVFLGDWLEGYHEFHITKSSGPKTNIVVWDPVNGNFFLPEDKKHTLYRKTARILTSYYNLETFEQIFPWHHAAGDFVIKIKADQLSVRLVTARGYNVLVNNEERDPLSVLEALLVFLLNLSIRNRLDRIDGVGEIAWADDSVVAATIEGFFEALGCQKKISSMAEPIDVFFRYYLESLSFSVLSELFEDIVKTMPALAPETSVVKRKIGRHSSVFYQSVQKFLKSI